MEEAKTLYEDEKKSNWLNVALVPAINTALLAFNTWKGNNPRSPFHESPVAVQDCLRKVCGTDCVRFPGQGDFFKWAQPYNTARSVVPTAVIRPRNVQDVSDVVKCAKQNNIKVQAKSGGHSFGNYGLGGDDGAIAIDLNIRNFQYVVVQQSTQQATIGAGSKLLVIDEILHKHGRTFAHGVCPGVGIGGHATVGGLGPMSRMWGTCADHILEVEAVTANGSIIRASHSRNHDLFFALRGAGAGFGVVTEFVMRTHPEPDPIVHLEHKTPYKNLAQIVDQLWAWQGLIADPELDRRFGTEFTLDENGARISATFYGSENEFTKSGIPEKLPISGYRLIQDNWMNTYVWQTKNIQMYMADLQMALHTHSLGFTAQDALSRDAIEKILRLITNHKPTKGLRWYGWKLPSWFTPPNWFIVFDATGGYIADIPMDDTAYVHRDKVMFYQSYAFNAFKLPETFSSLIDDVHNMIRSYLPPGLRTTYPGYIDSDLDNPQQIYWGVNLPQLEQIKSKWDPTDIFHNPQSVRPASSEL